MNEKMSLKNSPGNKKILAGIVIGIFSGIMLGGLAPEFSKHLAIAGEIFLNLLMMTVVPLVMLSMITGITNLGDIRNIGAVGRRTVFYYLATTVLSVLIGLVLVTIIRPGGDIRPGEQHPDAVYRIDRADPVTVVVPGFRPARSGYNGKYYLVLTDQGIMGLIYSVRRDTVRVASWESSDRDTAMKIKGTSGSGVPVKIEGDYLKVDRKVPALSGKGIEISMPVSRKVAASRDRGVFSTLREVIVGNAKENREGLFPRNIINAMVRMELLPLILFSLVFGAALSALGDRGAKAVEIISLLNDAILKVVDWIMHIAPVGIFGIIASRIGDAGGFEGFIPELLAVGKYSLTVAAGLTVHSVVVLPLILFFIGRRGPVRYLMGMAPALLNAFSTASSSATLPLTMENAEKGNGISARTASFVLPLGATINMDGTAMYEAVAAMFIAQVYGINLSFSGQVIIFITATLAAIGAAGIPEAGLVTMVIVLKAAGLPVEGIGLILTIDWLLDRLRTTVNVWGDAVGAGVVETLEMRAAQRDMTQGSAP